MYDIMDFECKGLKIEHVKDENYIVTVDVLDVNNDYVQLDLLLKSTGAILSDDCQIYRYLFDAEKIDADPDHFYDKTLAEIRKNLFYHNMIFFCPVTPNDFAKKAWAMAKLISRISKETLEPKYWSLDI